MLTSAGEPYIYYGEELGFYGVTKEGNGDQHVREPMQWGDNATTDYMSGINKSNVKSVKEQQSDANSLLNVYVQFSKLRNIYPALAQGSMTKHTKYNESNTTEKSIAVWYMTKDSEKLLVVHNFGASEAQISLADNIEKAIGKNGNIQQQKEGNNTLIKMPAYSSIVFKIAQ